MSEEREEPMRIVTLGHTAVGKTTYMASLYGELQQSFDGFTLGTESSDHTNLLSISRAIGRGTYPPATAHRSQYEFSLKFDGTEVLKFNWSDYSGGAIVRTSEDQQAQRLLQDLEEADGLMLMCDSEALSRRYFREIGRMTAIVARALRDLSHPISLAVVLTKSDLVYHFNQQMLSHFSGLIGVIEASNKVSGALIPVACGRQVMNVPMPLFFALQASVNYKANTLEREMESHLQQARVLRASNQGVDWLIDQVSSWWNEKPSKGARAYAEQQKANSKEKEYQKIKPSLEQINEQVQQLPLIKRGTSMSLYIEQLNQVKKTNSPNYLGYVDSFDAFLR